MPAFQTPDTFYFIAVDFENLGFGSGGDASADFDEVVDYYADLTAELHKSRVFRVEMGANNMPAGIADVTHEADAIIADRLARRHAATPVWEADPEHDNPDRFDRKCDELREAV